MAQVSNGPKVLSAHTGMSGCVLPHLLSHRTVSADGFPWLIPLCVLRCEILLRGSRGICLERVQGSRVLSLQRFLDLLYSELHSHWLRVCGFMERTTVIRRRFNSSLWATGLAQNDKKSLPFAQQVFIECLVC